MLRPNFLMTTTDLLSQQSQVSCRISHLLDLPVSSQSHSACSSIPWIQVNWKLDQERFTEGQQPSHLIAQEADTNSYLTIRDAKTDHWVKMVTPRSFIVKLHSYPSSLQLIWRMTPTIFILTKKYILRNIKMFPGKIVRSLSTVYVSPNFVSLTLLFLLPQHLLCSLLTS